MGSARLMILLSLQVPALSAPCAAQAILTPGAQSSDCHSALVVGVAPCRRHDRAAAPDAAPAVTEAQIDAFLQQYGKPPREAVRALLDPSDQNIAAWIRAERRTVAVASYVARRMTELQAQSPTSPADAARERAP